MAIISGCVVFLLLVVFAGFVRKYHRWIFILFNMSIKRFNQFSYRIVNDHRSNRVEVERWFLNRLVWPSDINCDAATTRARNPFFPGANPKTMKNPVSIEEFPKRLQQLLLDSGREMSAEFQSIQRISMELDRLYQQKVGQWPENRAKNRYVNILPCKYQ